MRLCLHRSGPRLSAMYLLVLLTWLPLISVGAEAHASEELRFTLQSRAMGFAVPYMVYLPPDYTADNRYPVWYAMHGYSGSETQWLRDAGIGKVADALMQSGALAPMLMVFPLTRYDSAKVIQEDLRDGKRDATLMEQFLCGELIPAIDAQYATQAEPQGRYIGGFSMGGQFALQIGLRHPELFSKIGAYSPAIADTAYGDGQLERWLYGTALQHGLMPDVRFAAQHGMDMLQVFMDYGVENDPFAEAIQAIAEALTARGVQVTMQSHPGGHTLRADLLENYLLFYGVTDVTLP